MTGACSITSSVGSFENPVSSREVFHNVYPEIPQNRYNKQGRFYLSTVERKSGPSNDQMTGVETQPETGLVILERLAEVIAERLRSTHEQVVDLLRLGIRSQDAS